MERRKKCRRGRRGPGDVRYLPIECRVGSDSVALEEERELTLQIVTGYQQRRERGLELGVLEELRQCRFQAVGRVLGVDDFLLRRQEVFFEDRRTILDV